MKHTDSRKGEEFDPLNSTCHLDVDMLIHDNYLMVDNATQLLTKVQKTLIKLKQEYFTESEIKQEQIQVQIDKLQIILNDYNDHLQYCIDSLEQAQQLKLDIDQEI